MIEPIKSSTILQEIANRHSKTIGQIILRWHIQKHTIPVIKTTNPNRMKENINVFDFNLSDEELNQISSLNQNYKCFTSNSVCCSRILKSLCYDKEDSKKGSFYCIGSH